MNMDISTLLLGSGFALFIALLAWGNQIREPRREIKKIEEEFRSEFKLRKSELTPIVRRSYENLTSADKYTFMDEMTALISIMEKNTLKDEKDVTLLSEFKNLNDTRLLLEKYYRNRYKLSIILTSTFLFLGVLSILSKDFNLYIKDIPFSVHWVYLAIVFILISLVLLNLISAYTIEEEFRVKIGKVADIIEGAD